EAANPTFGHLARLNERRGQRLSGWLPLLHHPDRHALGALGADPGKLLQLRDETPHGLGIVDCGHTRRIKVVREGGLGLPRSIPEPDGWNDALAWPGDPAACQ